MTSDFKMDLFSWRRKIWKWALVKFCIDSVFTRITSNLGRTDDEMLSNSASIIFLQQHFCVYTQCLSLWFQAEILNILDYYMTQSRQQITILTSEQEYSCLQMFLCHCSKYMWLRGPHMMSFPRQCKESGLPSNRRGDQISTSIC